MAANAENARIFGSDSDAIYLAPLGTPLPTSINAVLDGAFEDIGWLHSDGITESLTGSKSVIRGHQGSSVVRTRVEEGGTTFGFHALESKPLTRKLRYNEKSVTVVAGVRQVTRGAGQKVTAMVAVIDVFDADDVTVKERHVIPRLEIMPDGDRAFAGSDISGFPFMGEVIGDYNTFEGAGSDSTAAVWDVTVNGTPTGGTYVLAVNGYRSAAIAYNATAATVATALNALSGVTGISGITGSLAIKLTFPSAVVLTADGAGLTGGTTPSVTVAVSA